MAIHSIAFTHSDSSASNFLMSMQRKFLSNACSSPLYELGYILIPRNQDIENLVGAPTDIEPASPTFQVRLLTSTPQHPQVEPHKVIY